MGLDQYAYAAATETQYDEYWETAEMVDGEFVSAKVEKPREIHYWRKHPNLQGWMENLWRERGGDADQSFNGIQLELTWEDLERLERDIKDGNLPETTGFFFGEDADDYYRNQDLEFIKQARAEIFLGLRVFYNSSW